MKKVRLLISSIATLSVFGGLVSCNNTNGLSNSQKSNLEAFTGITFLNSVINKNATNNLLKTNMFDIPDEDAQKILPTLDALLTNGVEIKNTVKEKTTVIDGKTYNFIEEIAYKEGNKNENYILVYNKTSKTFEDHEIFETEITEYEKRTGYVVFGDVDKIDEAIKYQFTSHSESETEDGETEFERTFKINIDAISYILVEEENEEDKYQKETEFEYTFVNNGKIDIKYSISIENNLFNFTEVDYEINGKEYEAVAYSKDGNDYIRLEIEGKNDIDRTAVYLKQIDADGNVVYIKQ